MTQAYGRFPADPIDAGLLIRLKGKPAAYAVFIAVARHVNAQGEAYPSVKRLARLTGYGRTGIQKGIRDLTQAGMMTVVPGRGRGHANVYRLLKGSPAWAFCEINRPTPVTQKAHAGNYKRPTRVGPNSKGTDQEQQQAAAGVSSSPESASSIHNALAVVGINEPTRTRLAVDLAGLSQDAALKLIKAEASQAKERGKGAGVIVNNIRAAIERTKTNGQMDTKRKQNQEKWDRLPESEKVAYRAKMLQDKPNLRGHPELDGFCRANLDKLDAMETGPAPNPPIHPGGAIAPGPTPAGGG